MHFAGVRGGDKLPGLGFGAGLVDIVVDISVALEASRRRTSGSLHRHSMRMIRSEVVR